MGTLRAVRRRLANVFPPLAMLVGILVLAGCSAGKISASQTAAILKSDEPSWKKVSCHAYKDRYWDYTCRINSRIAGRFSFLVKVNGSGIADQSAP